MGFAIFYKGLASLAVKEKKSRRDGPTEKVKFSFIKQMKWTVIDSDATEQENSQQQSAVKKDELKQNQKKNQKKKQKRKRSDDCKYLELGELDGLNWQNIPYSESTPFTDEAAGGYTALEEIDDVEVLYEKNPGGNIVKFRVSFDKRSPSVLIFARRN